MIAEIALGIKLTNDAITLGKSAVDGISKVIGTAKDPSEVAGHLDQLFKAHHDHASLQKKYKNNTEWNKHLTQQLDDGDEIPGESISDVTAEVIHQKQIEEQIYKAKLMINRRFGRNTWNEILELREKRIEENKIKRKKAKEAFKEHQEAQREFWGKVWLFTWQSFVVVAGILVMWGWLASISKGQIPFLW